MIDFQSLASRLLSQARSLLPSWFPAGKMHGHEFCVGDLAGSEGESLKINVVTGRWQDFSTGDKGGDLISLYAAMHGIKQSEAVKQLDDGTTSPRVAPAQSKPAEPERAEWTPVIPVPADAPAPPDEFYRKMAGEWTKLVVRARWTYTNAAGEPVGHVCRFEWYDPRGELAKDVIPQVYCRNADGQHQWRWRAFAQPRPLYNLKELRDRPDAPVMVVEGEKKVEAIRKLAPQYVGIAWQGGAKAWRKSDWSPINGRKVLLWPDADQKTVKTEREASIYKTPIGELIPQNQQPGVLAMWEIGHHVYSKCPEVKIILPAGKPDGWDAADALADGMDWAALKEWALPLVQQITGATDGRQQSSSGVSTQQAAGRTVHGRAREADDRKGEASADADAPGDVAERRAQRAAGEDAERGEHGDHQDGEGGQGADQRPARGPQSDAGSGVEVRDDESRSAGRDHADRALSRTDAARPGSAQREGSRALRASADREALTPATSQGWANRWLALSLDRTGNGAPFMNLTNAMRVLMGEPSMHSRVWYDEFLDRQMTGEPPREWTDDDDLQVQLFMQAEIGLSKIGMDAVRGAVRMFAKQNARNCVRDWLDTLTWDEQPRIDQFFVDVFGAEDNEYTRAAGRNFWISIAARAYDPGCKVDNMIVLEGAQGLGKSMALRIIGGDWFAEQHESAANAKAFSEILKGKLLIEIAEMDAFNRTEVNTIKKVVSCQFDRYRKAYDREARDHQRQCVLVGTTNKDDWNRDETGARRFWPIRCAGLVRIDLVRENRAALFAEAVAEFKAGSTWWEMPSASTLREQSARFDNDPWLSAIESFLSIARETHMNEILIGCLKFELQKVGRQEHNRVASCLRKLGWTKGGNARRNGSQVRLWLPPSTDATVAANVGRSSDPKQQEEPNPFQ